MMRGVIHESGIVEDLAQFLVDWGIWEISAGAVMMCAELWG